MIIAYFRDFGVLKDTRKEYWGIQIVNFLDCTFYFAMLTIASLFLSHEGKVLAGNWDLGFRVEGSSDLGTGNALRGQGVLTCAW